MYPRSTVACWKILTSNVFLYFQSFIQRHFAGFNHQRLRFIPWFIQWFIADPKELRADPELVLEAVKRRLELAAFFPNA
jgi:hypothetical protein